MPQDLHELPKIRDSLSYLYIEHAIVDRKDSAIEFVNKDGRVHVPIAMICVILLGPGTSITHAAIKALAENGCLVLWTGEDEIRLYAHGVGETRKAYHLIRQAEYVCDPVKHELVVRRMYQKRFDELLDPGLSLPQIRGMEGVRVRRMYRLASETYGVVWSGRRYDFHTWGSQEPINRALSAANALLNGLCHAAITSGGYSAALGFVHVGRQLSFVYDIADLYKSKITIPIAFQTVAESTEHIDSRVRIACRQAFKEHRLLENILPDIDELLGISTEQETAEWIDPHAENPFPLWKELLEPVEGEQTKEPS